MLILFKRSCSIRLQSSLQTNFILKILASQIYFLINKSMAGWGVEKNSNVYSYLVELII